MAVAKYSIILPVRNGGHYVKACIGSILAQTFVGFELLVLDNCSTDGTTEWLSTLKDPRIRIFPAEKPLTIEENWGRIARIPKKEFITLIGHDDLLYPGYLATMDELIGRHPKASLYQTHFHYIDSGGAVIRRCKPMDERQTAAEFLACCLAHTIDSMGTGFLMRSADYDRLGGIPSYANLLYADFALWTNLTRIGYKATALGECFSFRLHQSTTRTSSDTSYLKAFDQFMNYLPGLASADPSFTEVIKRYSPDFIRFYCKALSHRLLRTPLAKRDGRTVNGFVDACEGYAEKLSPGSDFDPRATRSIRLALAIDRFWLTRELFLLFKKVYPKPVYA